MACDKMRKILLRDLNDFLICTLCNGYLIDATRLIECLHVFCRGCILRYFENSKTTCPLCNTIYKRKNQPYYRNDRQLQILVYKLVPGLFTKEMQRRDDFYRSTALRASSSCSDDSVLERERDLISDNNNDMITPTNTQINDDNNNNNDNRNCNEDENFDKTQFFGPDDYISLSLEYYQIHLDRTPIDGATTHHYNNGRKLNQLQMNPVVVVDKIDKKLDPTTTTTTTTTTTKHDSDDDKRYLQCPAAVSMCHLQKFVRMKFALTIEHRVDIIYAGEILPPHFSLMDVAYTFKWKRLKPMRFFYRIFTPLKIQPIRIVNYGKQLQIVQPTIDKVVEMKVDEQKEEEKKEHLLANLQLQSRNKVVQNQQVPENNNNINIKNNNNNNSQQECVFDYEEPDKEEIKRFAEIRDREWALQKKLDDSGTIIEHSIQEVPPQQQQQHQSSKKRKKSKHSKNDCLGGYKKRKLHAEITNKAPEELKLKVKLTHNNSSHKHKHHKNVVVMQTIQSQQQQQQMVELSSKEKLLQMRQIRHKHHQQAITTNQVGGNDQSPPQSSGGTTTTTTTISTTTTTTTITTAISEENQKIIQQSTTVVPTTTKTLRSDFPLKQTLTNRVATVQLERNEQAEKATKQLAPNNNNNNNRVQNVKKVDNRQLERKLANLQQRCTVETKAMPPQQQQQQQQEKKVGHDTSRVVTTTTTTVGGVLPPNCPPGFTVSKIETTTTTNNNKRKFEQNDNNNNNNGVNGDKRPSLEITLINPTTTVVPTESKPVVAKRPPPATIPLERIKKSINLKSGISIIPKLPPTTTTTTIPGGGGGSVTGAVAVAERCDNIGALDLSKTNKGVEIAGKSNNNNNNNKVNGFVLNNNNNNNNNSKERGINTSNLQMLSKVASEHASNGNHSKPRPQMPSLQTLKIPSLVNNKALVQQQQQQQQQKVNKITVPNSTAPVSVTTLTTATTTPTTINNNNKVSTVQNPKIPNLYKLPKLQEINKSHFRSLNPQIRNLRPNNQNQSIRNIPNPSLLVRQQNQNRLNSMMLPTVQQQQQKQQTPPAAAEAPKKDAPKPTSPPMVVVVKQPPTPPITPTPQTTDICTLTTTTTTTPTTTTIV